VPEGFYRAEGMIKNVNTIEEYRNTDKTLLLEQSGRMVSSSARGVLLGKKRNNDISSFRYGMR
jgi:hypothetical protein